MAPWVRKEMGIRKIRLRRLLRAHPLIYVSWLALCLFLTGCHQDMYNQPKYRTYRPSDFFADGRSARPPVPNTIAVGQFSTDPHYLTGRTVDGVFASELPFPLTREIMAQGQSRYNAYCMPCHGMLGDGKGIVAQRGPLIVPSFHSQRLRDAQVGYYFDVMTNGFGIMYSYAARIPAEDRWAITAYIRALQLSQNATIEDINPDERSKLKKTTTH